ncbi:MAG: DUF4199 domain-containing protein [Gemmatimonadales bacterium]
MNKIVLTFGLISGAILSVMMVITQVVMDDIGFDKGEIIGYTTMILASMMVFFGVRSYRDNVAGGSLSFGKALLVGLLIALVANVCYVVTWEFIYFNITPDFMEKYAAYAIEKARASGATAQEIAKRTKEIDEMAVNYKNPLINVAYTFLEPLPVGLLASLLAAAVFRRKRSPVEAT